MHFFSALLFVFSANLDNIVIGIAYGMKKIRMRTASNFLIALFTTAGTLTSMWAGKLLTAIIPASTAGKIGAGVLVLLGCVFFGKSVLHSVRQSKKAQSVALRGADEMLDYAERSDRDVSGSIDVKEALAVGLGLTLNNLGTGLVAGVSGIPVFLAAAANFAVSFFFLTLGFWLGSRLLGRLPGKFAPFLSGLLLILLGLIEWFC